MDLILQGKFVKYLEKLYNAKLEANKFKTIEDQNKKFAELTRNAKTDFESYARFQITFAKNKIIELKAKYRNAMYGSTTLDIDFLTAQLFCQKLPERYIDLLQKYYEDHKRNEFILHVIDILEKSANTTQTEINKLHELRHKIEIDKGVEKIKPEIEELTKQLQDYEMLKNYSYDENDIMFNSLNTKLLDVIKAENSILFQKIFEEKFPLADYSKWNLK